MKKYKGIMLFVAVVVGILLIVKIADTVQTQITYSDDLKGIIVSSPRDTTMGITDGEHTEFRVTIQGDHHKYYADSGRSDFYDEDGHQYKTLNIPAGKKAFIYYQTGYASGDSFVVNVGDQHQKFEVRAVAK